MSIAQQLANFSSSTSLANTPQEAISAARRCIVDVFGVTLAGLDTDTGRAAQRVASNAYGAGPCCIPGSRDGLSVAGAAQVLGTAAHVWDYDDTCHEGIVHGSAVVWSAVAAIAQARGLNGRQTLEAFIAGVETEYALGGVITSRLFYQGWWPTGVLGVIGAAAGVARALSLDATVTAHAIALAAAQAVGSRRLLGWPSKPWLCGRAAEGGVLAALYACEGLTAAPDTFEHTFGFAALHNGGYLNRDALLDLGERWRLLLPGVALKLYPACSSMQAATEATLELMREQGLQSGDVSSVTCEVTRLVDESLAFNEPRTVTEAQFSMPFAIACALKFGEFTLQQLNDSIVHDPDLRALFAKVKMVRSTDSLASETAEREFPEGAIVTLQTTDHRTFTRMNGVASGMPAKPMPDSLLDRKFLDCARCAGVSPNAADRMLGALRTIEKMPSILDLFALRPDEALLMTP